LRFALYGREGLDELKLRRLLDMLEAAPNITSSQRKWIESRWKTYDRIRSDPQELFRVLKDEAGVKDKIASAIVQAVFSLESEYADILARRGEPVFMYGRTAGATEPSIEVYQQYPWQRTPRTYRPETYPTYPPYEPPSPPSYGYMYGYQPYYPRSRYAGGEPITKEELNELLDKWFSDRFEKRKLEEQINFLRNALEGVKDYVEETKHEFEKKLLMKEKEKEKDKSSEEVQLLTAKLEEAYSRINELSSQISALASTLEKREKDRLEAEIRTLREQQRELIKRLDEIGSRPTGEYSSDAYRLMSDLVREVRHRKPLEAIARILFPERFAVHPERLPSSSPLPPAMESELRAAGLLESYGG